MGSVRLTSKPQGFSCICQVGAEIASIYYHTLPCKRIPGIQTHVFMPAQQGLYPLNHHRGPRSRKESLKTKGLGCLALLILLTSLYSSAYWLWSSSMARLLITSLPNRDLSHNKPWKNGTNSCFFLLYTNLSWSYTNVVLSWISII